jgi:hypothetical protein
MPDTAADSMNRPPETVRFTGLPDFREKTHNYLYNFPLIKNKKIQITCFILNIFWFKVKGDGDKLLPSNGPIK